MAPLIIGACVGGCLAVGAHMSRRRGRGRRRRGFFGFGRRRPRFVAQGDWQPSGNDVAVMRRLVREYATLFCRAHPPCTRARILGDQWARGYVARQVGIALTGGSNFEPVAEFVHTNMERLL